MIRPEKDVEETEACPETSILALPALTSTLPISLVLWAVIGWSAWEWLK